jgi:predicted MPP superfamily phosphohydrolase
MRVFYNALIFHLIFNVYVFIRGRQVLPPNKNARILFAIPFAVELVVYFTGFIFNVHLPHEWLRVIMLIGTSWMVLIGYISAFLLIYDLFIFLGRKFERIRAWKLQSLEKRRIYFVSVCLFVIAIMLYGNYRFMHPVANEYNLSINKQANGMEKLRIAFVSDIHLGYLIDRGILSMYVDKIMEQKPDIVLIAGDIIDYDLTPLEEQKMDEELQRLKAPYGVYASTGNHEYRLNAEDKIAWLINKSGINVLRDKAVKIADSFYLVGREDDKCPNRKKLSEIMQGVDKRLPVIVINHEPHALYEESGQNVDAALYGHTHNGQVFPYNIVMSLLYEKAYGYKKKGNTHVYVTSGLGIAGPQYRIGTVSEIAVLNLSFNH